MAILLSLITLGLLCACGGSSTVPTPSPTPTKDPDVKAYEKELADKIYSSLPFPARVSVKKSDDRTSVSISPMTSNVTYFGDRVYDTIAVCDEIFGEEVYSFSLMDLDLKTGNSLLFGYDSGKEGIGTFSDDRSGTLKRYECKTFDDLAEFFPALRIHIAEEEVAEDSQEDIALYRYVMDRLDAEPNRPEEEIFAEIAPEYGITADELKQFIFEMMEKIY